MTKKTIKIQLIRSLIGHKKYIIGTVKGLGLRKINSVKELEDTDSVRGMIDKVAHLVKIVS